MDQTPCIILALVIGTGLLLTLGYFYWYRGEVNESSYRNAYLNQHQSYLGGYNSTGVLYPWITPEDRIEMEKKRQRMYEQRDREEAYRRKQYAYEAEQARNFGRKSKAVILLESLFPLGKPWK